jgi:hypothetical protein
VRVEVSHGLGVRIVVPVAWSTTQNTAHQTRSLLSLVNSSFTTLQLQNQRWVEDRLIRMSTTMVTSKSDIQQTVPTIHKNLHTPEHAYFYPLPTRSTNLYFDAPTHTLKAAADDGSRIYEAHWYTAVAFAHHVDSRDTFR